jgi:hypothetical protein
LIINKKNVNEIIRENIMKKLVFIIIIITLFFSCAKKEIQEAKSLSESTAIATNEPVSQNSDNYDNGLIIKTDYIDNANWIFRKHVQKIPNDREFLNVFDFPDGTEVITLENTRAINTLELAHKEDLHSTIWLKIKYDVEKEGWIQGGDINPYADGNGSVIETINTGDKDWTVIKLASQKLYAVNGLNIRDKPGLTGTNVLFQINYDGEPFSFDYYDYMRVDILAMTKEKDTINDNTLSASERTSPWIKIRTQNDLEGWVFGGYLDVWVRGGAPKFITPENIVSSMYMNY